MAESGATDERPRQWSLTRWPLEVLGHVLRAFATAIDGFFRDRLTQHAAGIAYRVLFSLAPLAIVLVSIVGFVLQDDARRQNVVDEIVSWLPFSDEGSDTVENAITRLASPTSVLGLVSLVLFFWAASGMMGALRTGLEAALRVERRRPAVRAKLVDLVLVIGAGVLVIAMLATAIVAQIVTRMVRSVATDLGVESGLFAELIRVGVPLLVSTVVVVLLYRFVPARRLRFVDAVAGGVVTGVLLLVISAASAIVYEHVADLSVIYGSLTAVLVFLYSVYLYAAAVLFGAEFAAAWSAPPPTGPSEPLLAQVKRAAIGLVVRREPPTDDPPPSTGR